MTTTKMRTTPTVNVDVDEDDNEDKDGGGERSLCHAEQTKQEGWQNNTGGFEEEVAVFRSSQQRQAVHDVLLPVSRLHLREQGHRHDEDVDEEGVLAIKVREREMQVAG